MMRVPGPICIFRLGEDWIDSGTLVRTRLISDAERLSQGTASSPPLLSKQEQQLLDALDGAGITDVRERAMFLAQVSHESNDFRSLRENLHYSAKKLYELFPKHFESVEEAQETVEQGPSAIAEEIYGNRKALGNVDAGDGARYIGRGYIQLTGRSNYAAAGEALGLDLVNHPELAEEPENAARIAVWFWQRDKRLGKRARAGDVVGVTKIINGGTIGLEDRKKRYEHYLKILTPSQSQSLQRPVVRPLL